MTSNIPCSLTFKKSICVLPAIDCTKWGSYQYLEMPEGRVQIENREKWHFLKPACQSCKEIVHVQRYLQL